MKYNQKHDTTEKIEGDSLTMLIKRVIGEYNEEYGK